MTEKLELSDGYVVVCVHCAKELNIEFDEQKPLSDEEIAKEWSKFYPDVFHTHLIDFVRAIEETHGIK